MEDLTRALQRLHMARVDKKQQSRQPTISRKGTKKKQKTERAKEVGTPPALDAGPLIALDAAALIHVINDLEEDEPLIITTETTAVCNKYGRVNGIRMENPWMGDRVVKRSRVATRARPDFRKELMRARAARLETSSETAAQVREMKSRKWGSRLQGTPYVVHVRKGETELRMYLEVIVLSSLGHQYYLEGTGEELTSKQLAPYRSGNRACSEESSSSTAEKEDGVIWRDYDIRNIVRLEARGKHYVIAPNFRLPPATEAAFLHALVP